MSGVGRIRGHHGYAGREFNQSLEASAVHRQILGELPVYDCADRGVFRVYERYATLYRHGLKQGADRKGEVDGQRVLYIENDVRFDNGFEANL